MLTRAALKAGFRRYPLRCSDVARASLKAVYPAPQRRMSVIPRADSPRSEMKTMMRSFSALALVCILTRASLAAAQSSAHAPSPAEATDNPIRIQCSTPIFPDPPVIRAPTAVYAYATQTIAAAVTSTSRSHSSRISVAWAPRRCAAGEARMGGETQNSGASRLRHGDATSCTTPPSRTRRTVSVSPGHLEVAGGPLLESGRPLRAARVRQYRPDGV